MTIEEWQQQNSEVDLYGASSTGGFTFDPGFAYVVKVAEAKVAKSQRGVVQIALKLSVVNPANHGEIYGAGYHYLDFPCQDTDKDLARDAIVGITHRRRDELMRLLIAAGKIKENAPEKDRYVETYAWAEDARELTGSLDELVDAEFYLAVKANPHKPDYPYKNVYNKAPKGYTLYTGEDAHGNA